MTLLYYVFIPEATKKHNKFKMIVYKSIKAAVVWLNQIQHSKNIKSIFIQVIWHWLESSTGGKILGSEAFISRAINYQIYKVSV